MHESLGTNNSVRCFLGKGPSVPWVTNPKNENFQGPTESIDYSWEQQLTGENYKREYFYYSSFVVRN